MAEVKGKVEIGFEHVKDVFQKNFDKGIEEYGAAFTVYHKGKQVVNLWGGWADKRACVRWQKDTMAVSFSATKGCAALCVAILVDQGYLCYDDQVTKYWPEFEKHGKDDVTVKQLLSHQAGLAQVDQPLTLEIMKDRDAISSVLEDQSPLWLPGTAHGYHILTHGMLIDQLLRRVDPKKRTVGQFFKDEVAEKFDIEYYIGLPRELNHRVARVCAARASPLGYAHVARGSAKLLWSAVRQGVAYKSLWKMNPSFLHGVGCWNNPEIREMEIPSANGIGTSTALAKLYSILATTGELDGQVLLKPDTITKMREQVTSGKDVVMGDYVASQFTAGGFFTGCEWVNSDGNPLFGSPGYGRIAAFADPDNDLSFCYLTNAIKSDPMEPRALMMTGAMYRCLDRMNSEM